MQNQENNNTKSSESKIAMSRNNIGLWIKEIWLSGKGWNTNIEFLFWRSFAPESQSASKVIFSICQYQLSKIRWCWLFLWWWSTWLWLAWWCLRELMIKSFYVNISFKNWSMDFFTGDIQLEQEGLSGLYDPQVNTLNNKIENSLPVPKPNYLKNV